MVKKVHTTGSYVNTKNDLVKAKGDPFNNEVTTYRYNGDQLFAEVNISNVYFAFNKERMGGSFNYFYDAKGNLTQKEYLNPNGDLTSTYQYTYNDKNQLIKSVWFKTGQKKAYSHEQFTYTLDGATLVKLQSSYNTDDVLIQNFEYDYDANGNQIKGYNIAADKKTLIWDYKYDTQNRVTESRGGPARDKFMMLEDIRRDGLAHLVYAYSADGLLTEIKKYRESAEDHQEHLSAIQKMVYIKY